MRWSRNLRTGFPALSEQSLQDFDIVGVSIDENLFSGSVFHGGSEIFK